MKLLASFALASLFLGAAVAQADPLAVGAPAPMIVAIDQDGKAVDFKTVYAKGPTLVYFYPKADTPGCTAEACSLHDNWDALQAKGIQVLGVSEDAAESQKKFQTKYSLQFALVADTNGKVAEAFGVPFRGHVTARQSFLIKDGKVVWNMLEKTTTKTHAQDVLKAYDGLPRS